MKLGTTIPVVTAVILAVSVGTAPAASGDGLTLVAVQYPERKDVDLNFARTAAAPRAVVTGEVEYREGQAKVELEFDGMKPALLFGGDVTCYVVWAVTRESAAENLGELWVRGKRGGAEYSTGLKEFALLVTAETHPLVAVPSELAVFYSLPVMEDGVRDTRFSVTGLAPAPRHTVESLAEVTATTDVQTDLAQAKKAMEIAERMEASAYAPGIMREASVTLAQATNLATSRAREKEMIDFSRRTVALAGEAMRTTERKKEAERLASLIAERRMEMERLEERAAEAERLAREAAGRVADLERSMREAQAAMETIRLEKGRLERETSELEREKAELVDEKTSLEQLTAQLRVERSSLEAAKQELEAEKAVLSQRLEGALSEVASTESSARGMIVNLPDILFAFNEATLKPAAKITIAKLAGILLIMPELNLRVEGHTDSVGSEAYNLGLSRRRAESVVAFLADQGIEEARMTAVGYGEVRPVADNSTEQGRARNRRVEIVIAEGVVQEAPES